MLYPRLTILRMMIMVALIAIGLSLFRMFGAFGCVVISFSMSLGYLGFLLPPKELDIGFGAVIFVSTIFSIWVAPNELYTLGMSWFEISHIVLILATPMIVGLIAGLTVDVIKRKSTGRIFGGLALTVVSAISPWSMIMTHWPMFLAFALSQREMNQLVDRITAGQTIGYPVRTGFYEIKDSKKTRVNGADGLLLMIDDGPNHTGFVWEPSSYRRINLSKLGDGWEPRQGSGAWRFQLSDLD